MIGNKFNYVFVDGSFLLTRNLFVATKGKDIKDMNPGDVVKITIQTLTKLAKTWGITADKIFLIFDEWDKNLGGYIRSWMIRDYVQYKGSRKWVTAKTIEDMKNDPTISQEEIEKAERELAVNNVKFAAKSIMKEEFKNIGIPYVSWPGWEFDDIATMASFILNGKTDKPNVIVTKDTDLQYSLCPSCVFFSLPTSGSEPKIITYDEMYNTIPQTLRDRGVGLYQYHSFCDSLGISGHNDNLKTIKSGRNGVTTILHILDGDYSDVANKDAFDAQMKSFNLSLFPDVSEVQNMILNKFQTLGHVGSLSVFRDFCNRNKISGISDTYYMGLTERFDQKLFSNEGNSNF